MSALLDLHPDCADAVSAGVAELHGVLDRLHAARQPLVHGRARQVVAEVDRAIRRLEALKLKLVAAADQAGTAKDAGFTDTNAWVAKTTTVSRSDAARQVALATELESGHDATAEALDAGLVSPGHAAVIVQATGQLPEGVSAEQRQVVEASLVEKAGRFSPDQLRRVARRAIEAVEPDQTRGRRPRERARPHRGASRPGQVLAHAARQRRRHHHRTLHRPRPRRRDPGQDPGRDDRTTTHARARLRQRNSRTGRSTGGTAAGSRSPSSSSTCPPTTCTPRAPPPWSSPSTTPSCRRPQGSPPRHRPDPLRRRSPPARLQRRDPPRRPRRQVRRPRPRPHSPALLRVPASGERSRTHHLRRHRLRTPLRLVRAPPPKAWAHGGRTDLQNAIPLCHQHHQWIHDTGFNHQSMPDGSVRFSGGREDRRGSGYVQR